MRIKSFLPVLCVMLFIGRTNAQFSRYIIQLKDKNNSIFSVSNPSQFLSQRAIDRRTKYNIPVTENDLPVNQVYIDSIAQAGKVTILNVSKWFNQVCIKTTDAQAIDKINSFSFVVKSSAIAARAGTIKKEEPQVNITTYSPGLQRPLEPGSTYYNYGLASAQVQMHNTDFLHNHGFRGKGLQITLTDAGFLNYNTLPTFDSIRNNNQILGTWDFVANKASVSEEFVHGMKCLSAIAANLPGKFIGTAPEASFYLYRTEDVSSEYPIEEQFWVAAAERADSIGADMISVSLGYNRFDNNSFDYTYADMNGKTSIISKGVNSASEKGMMVVVSAGNDGADAWHYISTPADAEKALTVGAVDVLRQPASFSSYGPSSDGRIKPDVAAVGLGAVVANQTNGLPEYGNGTSYACPIMAGVTACLWQAFPEINNSTLLQTLRQSSDKSNNPDNRTGYGIPDAKKAFVLLLKSLHNQQAVINDSCTVKYSWNVKADAGMKFIIERKLSGDTGFIAIETKNGVGGFSKQNFIFSDDLKSLSPNISIQYRIKMVIAPDTSFYLDSTTLNYTTQCNVEDKMIIAPNPVKDDLKVTVSQNNQFKVSILIHNTNGQLVYSLPTQTVNLLQTFNIPMKQMNAGVYYVTVLIDNKKKLSRKIVRE